MTMATGPRPVTRKAGAPPPAVGDQLRDQEREADADGEARRVESNGARGVAGGKPVRQRLQARHVGAGKSKPCKGPDRGRRPEPLREDSERSGRQPADDRAPEQDNPRVDPVGQCRQHGHREHVAECITACHQPAFGGGEAPLRHQMLRQICGQGHMRQQVADLPYAHHRNQRPTAEPTNFVLLPGEALSLPAPREAARARRRPRPRRAR
ncbi:hypothetical protein ACVMGC_009749 [Bradyrhizobium barranii subsp. barranii]